MKRLIGFKVKKLENFPAFVIPSWLGRRFVRSYNKMILEGLKLDAMLASALPPAFKLG